MHIVHDESADFVAEALGPAHLTRQATPGAIAAASGEACYCEQAELDREGRSRAVAAEAPDLYAVALAGWLGVSRSELDAILRNL
jgi:hypothetical protein